MSKYTCNICNRNFRQKCHLDDHLNRKNKCQIKNTDTSINSTTPSNNSIVPSNNSIVPSNNANLPPIITNLPPITTCHPPIITILQPNIITSETNNVTTPTQINHPCNYCEKSFARKDNLTKHMRLTCKVLKQQNKDRQEIFDKLTLVELKNKQLEEEIKNKDKVIENKDKQLENKDKQFDDKIMKLVEEINTLRNEIKIIQPSSINTNSNNIMNNSNNTVNVINIVPHGQEDLAKNKIDDLLLIISTKKGYNSVLELISRVHFNSKFPEFHNVYIPNIKNNTAMVFDKEWELRNIEDVITDLHDSKSDYIMDNKDIFYKHLNIGEQAVYARWVENNNNRDTAEFKEYITDIHQKIKLLMYNKREMVIETKKLQAIKK